MSVRRKCFAGMLSLFVLACAYGVVGASQNKPGSVQENSQQVEDTGKVIHRILLIGDAGKGDKSPGKQHLASLTERLKKSDLSERLVFLGDNIYQHGFQSDDLSCDSTHQNARRLTAILDIAAQSNSESYLLPGNHDWDGSLEGRDLILKQKQFIESCGKGSFYEPARDEQLLLLDYLEDEFATLIFLDSFAIINGGPASQRLMAEEFNRILASTDPDKILIVSAHHPLATQGPHGGCFGDTSRVKNSVFEFIWETFITGKGDIGNEWYDAYVSSFLSMVPEQRKVIFAAGHDHNLQVLQEVDKTKPLSKVDYMLVSGSASKTTFACHEGPSLFSQAETGYMALEFLDNGELYLRVFVFQMESDDGGSFKQAFSSRLFDAW